MVGLLAGPTFALAQETPLGLAGGRLLLGGDVVATAGREDDDAFFNYTDYEHNALRMVRIALAAEWRVVDRLAVVGEVRSEDFDGIRPHALYARVRPWSSRRFDIQVGRIPPTFGAYGRRAYASNDGLIGYPLAYQYLTSLRPDAAPATSDDVLVMRARGWRSDFPIGNAEAAPGVPLVTGFRWDTGIQAHWASERLTITTAVTNGTLSAPRFRDDNDGRQVSARVTVRPRFGLILGGSLSRGAWLSNVVADVLPESSRQSSHAQTAAGADVEYSRDHWIVRAEAVWSQWRVPTPMASEPSLALRALGAFVEGQYRFTPRVFAAVRLDTLTFSSITGSFFNGAPTPWDAPVRRVEAGAGYRLHRHVTARLAVQRNWRDGGRIRARTLASGQLSYWF